jgi:hypothetical protein
MPQINTDLINKRGVAITVTPLLLISGEPFVFKDFLSSKQISVNLCRFRVVFKRQIYNLHRAHFEYTRDS